MARGRDLVFNSIGKPVFMKANGIETREMDVGWRGTPMVIDTKVILKMENQMAMVFLLG